ncbi:transposable element Tcb2 transposase [Trichonephila clavipes]|nr:transposable element Tcb2 transposase [Trichonephila clavipes]
MPSCHSVHDLELAVQDWWAHLHQDNIRCLINSMPDRVAACIATGGATETSRNITARFIERDTSGEIYYFPEGSELANMVAIDAKMVAKVTKNDANLALPPSSH